MAYTNSATGYPIVRKISMYYIDIFSNMKAEEHSTIRYHQGGETDKSKKKIQIDEAEQSRNTKSLSQVHITLTLFTSARYEHHQASNQPFEIPGHSVMPPVIS
jgi:hypothetical protein